MRQILIYAFFVPLVEILSSGTIGLLLWYGGGKVVREVITLGALVAFLSYIYEVKGDLDDPRSEVSSLLSSRDWIRLREGLETKPKVYYLLK
jgi:ABC-type multidrug transport system fused ATPase/permease subunit